MPNTKPKLSPSSPSAKAKKPSSGKNLLKTSKDSRDLDIPPEQAPLDELVANVSSKSKSKAKKSPAPSVDSELTGEVTPVEASQLAAPASIPPQAKAEKDSPKAADKKAKVVAEKPAKAAKAPKAEKPAKKEEPKPVVEVKRAPFIEHNPETHEKIRELIKLAKEQGYLTYEDLNEALPDAVTDPDEMEVILSRLRLLEIDLIDASEVDRYKDGKKDSDDDKDDKDDNNQEEEKADNRLDILDDPVRMYLKQMGQVPLLTREQEVEISKRIEDAEVMVQKHINRFGFTARAHLDLAQKLLEGRERFDRVILDKKIESRERYMKLLPKLIH
ncbi:MAG TPA: RNA polymerase sigma factor region1.1 domain-containing protein, partial [Chthoniobacterales bacterium]